MICRNIFSIVAYDRMVNDLRNIAKRICLHWDTSTTSNTKMLVLLAKYYQRGKGIQFRCCAVRSIVGETAEDMTRIIREELERIEVDKKKIIAISADNTNSSFGGKDHKGAKNVREFLQNWLGRKLLVCPCIGHIGHNSVKEAVKATKETFDVEAAINKPYTEFNQQVKKRQILSDIWKDQLKKTEPIRFPLSYIKTRWLSINPCFVRLIVLKEPLTIYSEDTAKTVPKPTETQAHLIDFYGEKCNLNFALLKAFHSMTRQIHSNLKMIQPTDATIMTGIKVISNTKSQLLPLAKCKKLTEMELSGTTYGEFLKDIENEEDKRTYLDTTSKMLTSCYDYMDDWTKRHECFENFQWASLETEVTVGQVITAFSYLNNPEGLNIKFKDDPIILYDQVEVFEEYRKRLPEEGLNTVEKWDQIYNQAKEDGKDLEFLYDIADCILCCSPTNALVERVFSEINHFWTDEKSNLSFQNIWALLMIRYNLARDVKEFTDFCKARPDLVEMAGKDDKYLSTSAWEESVKEKAQKAIEQSLAVIANPLFTTEDDLLLD